MENVPERGGCETVAHFDVPGDRLVFHRGVLRRFPSYFFSFKSTFLLLNVTSLSLKNKSYLDDLNDQTDTVKLISEPALPKKIV